MLDNALMFLITAVFNIYIFVLIVRTLFAYAHMHYFHPVVQVVTRLTQPIIAPLRKIIPNFHNIELSTVLVILLLSLIKLILLSVVASIMPTIPTLILLSVCGAIKLLLNTWFYAIIIQAILSWVQSTQYRQSHVNEILSAITSPILSPFQRIIPTIGGFDISMIPALIILQFLMLLLPG